MAITPRGIRKRSGRDGNVRWQVRFLVRDAETGEWVETSRTFPTLASAKAFKAERDTEVAAGLRRFDPRAGRVALRMVWDDYAAAKRSGTRKKKQVKRGGPGWDRTSDLPRVKRTDDS